MESKAVGGGGDDGWRPAPATPPPALPPSMGTRPPGDSGAPNQGEEMESERLSLPPATSLMEGIERQQRVRGQVAMERAGPPPFLSVDHRRIWESSDGIAFGAVGGSGHSRMGIVEGGEKLWDDVPDLPSGDLAKPDGQAGAKQAWLGRVPQGSYTGARGEEVDFPGGAPRNEFLHRPADQEMSRRLQERGDAPSTFGWIRDEPKGARGSAGAPAEEFAGDKSRGFVLPVQRPATVGAPQGTEAAVEGEIGQSRLREDSMQSPAGYRSGGKRSAFPLHPMLPAIDTGEGDSSGQLQVPRLGVSPRMFLHPTLSVPLAPAPGRSVPQSLPSIAPRPPQPQPQHQMFLAFPDGLGGKRRPSVVPVSLSAGTSLVPGSAVNSQYSLLGRPGQAAPPVHVQQAAMQAAHHPGLSGPPGGYATLPMIVPATAGAPGSGSALMAPSVTGPRSGLYPQPFPLGTSPRGVLSPSGKFYPTVASSVPGGGPQPPSFPPTASPTSRHFGSSGMQSGSLQPIAPKRTPEPFRPGAPYAIRAGGAPARPTAPGQLGVPGQPESLGLTPYSAAPVDGQSSRGLRLATLPSPGGFGMQAAGLSAPPPLARGRVGGDAMLLGSALPALHVGGPQTSAGMSAGPPRESPATRKPLGGGLSVSLDGGMEPRSRNAAGDEASPQWRSFGLGRPGSPGSTSATYSEYSQRHGAASPPILAPISGIRSSGAAMPSMSVPAVFPRMKKSGKQFQPPSLSYPVAGSSFGNAPEMIDAMSMEPRAAMPRVQQKASVKRKRAHVRDDRARIGFEGSRKMEYGAVSARVGEEEEEEEEEEGARKEVRRGVGERSASPVPEPPPRKDETDICEYVPKRTFLRSINFRQQFTHRVRICRKYLRTSHPAISRRLLWGDRTYFVDSDLVAVVVHSGKAKLTVERPANDLLVELEGLNPAAFYAAKKRHGVQSRELSNEKLEGRGFVIWRVDWTPPTEKKHGPASENEAGSDSDGGASSGDEPDWGDLRPDSRHFVTEFSLCFGLGNQPCFAYSLATMADRGIEAKLRVSARLRRDVLYLETERKRFELLMLEDGRLQFAAVKDPLALRPWTSGCPLERELVKVLARPLLWDDIEWAESSVVVAGIVYGILRVFWHQRDTALREIADEPVPLLAVLRERPSKRGNEKGAGGMTGVGEEEAEHEADGTTEAESATGAEGTRAESPADGLLDSVMPTPPVDGGVDEEREEGTEMVNDDTQGAEEDHEADDEDQDVDEERDEESRPTSPNDGDAAALQLGDEAAVAILSPKLTAAAAELERQFSPKLSAKLAEVAELERLMSPKLSPKLAEAVEMERRKRDRRSRPARRPR